MGDLADEKYDLEKQIRIAARNKRLAMRLGDERIRREAVFPLWMLLFGVTFILSGLALAVHVLECLRGLL